MLVCLFVGPFAANKRQLNCSGPNFVWDLTDGRIMNAQNYKYLCPKVFDFLLNLKNARKNIINSANLFLFCVYNEKIFTDRATI